MQLSSEIIVLETMFFLPVLATTDATSATQDAQKIRTVSMDSASATLVSGPCIFRLCNPGWGL
jgi:hypothetical protein